MKQDNAFTGLEAAIVLIAFVVVAAIFSYVMLGAGFFATQKAQEVTYAGVKQTTSNLIPDGTIYGDYDPDPTTGGIELLQFSVTVPVGGQAQQLTDLVLTYSKEGETPVNYVLDDSATGESDLSASSFGVVSCTTKFPGPGGSDCTTGTIDTFANPDCTLVPPGNSCNLLLMLENDYKPKSGEWFQIEVKPPIGAPTTIKRTIPTGYLGGKLT